MPSAYFGRRRTRTTPKPKNFIPCGYLLKKHAVTGAILSKVAFSPAAFPLNENEVTWDTVHKGPPYHTGGNFASIKAHSDANTVKGTGSHRSPIQEGWWYWEYTGGFIRPATSQDISQMQTSLNPFVANPYQVGYLDNQEALGVGQTAWDSLVPRIQKVQGFVALAEMRDFTRMLRTSSAFFAKGWDEVSRTRTRDFRRSKLVEDMSDASKEGAENFLNHHFGWAPFIKDLTKVVELLGSQIRIMKQTALDNGNWIRRGRSLSETEVVTAVRSGYAGGLPWRNEFDLMCNNLDPNLYSPYSWQQTDTTKVTMWAKGQFSYYRPEFDMARMDYMSSFNRVRRVLSTYGLRVNPSTLWKITPWSWLVDWFTGFGAWLARVQNIADDGIVAKYLYIMRKVEKTTTHRVTINWKDGPQHLQWMNSFDSKQREEASNPFGFTLPAGGLSAKQLHILAALGLSRRKSFS